jgi:flagellar biosynthesis component FlhA
VALKLANYNVKQILSRFMDKFEAVARDADPDQLTKVTDLVRDSLEGFIGESFWYDEADVLVVRIIDQIEEDLGLDLESATYEGKADQLIKFFGEITRIYTEHPR